MTRSVYLAARYSRHPEMSEKAIQLSQIGYTITSRWIRGDHELRSDGQADSDRWAEVWALEDYEDLLAADIVISFTEEPGAPGRQRGGRHVEFGLGLATDKVMVVIGPRENVFHWLPEVRVYPTWEAFLEAVVG